MADDSYSEYSPRRSEPRIKMALQVRIWGIDSQGATFVQNVNTADISSSGACLSAVTARLKAGDVIGVQYGSEKARYRVAWAKQAEGAVELNVGLCAVDAVKCLWQSKLVAPVQLDNSPIGADRRIHVRVPCDGSAGFSKPGSAYQMWGTVTDISSGGCYLQTVSTMPVNSQVELKITIDHTDVSCVGEVRTSHPSVGMGVQFSASDSENQQKLYKILEALEMAQGDNLPQYMRVLTHIERIRECLSLIDQIIRQDPGRMVPVLAESISGVQAQVNQLLQQQREAVTETKL